MQGCMFRVRIDHLSHLLIIQLGLQVVNSKNSQIISVSKEGEKKLIQPLEGLSVEKNNRI